MRLIGPDPLGYTIHGTRSVLLVRVDTDREIWGLGEAADWPGVETLIRDYGAWLVGRDPLQINAFSHSIIHGGLPPFEPEQNVTVLPSGPVVWAVSGIEIALHDIAGKAAGLPVYALLGGKFRDRQRLYLHCVSSGTATKTDEHPWVAASTAAIESGFDFVKFDVEQAAPEMTRDPRNRNLSSAQLDAIGERFLMVRETIGPARDLCADGHMHYDVPSAISLSRELSRCRLAWLEDPVPALNTRALAAVRSATEIPICAGEMFTLEQLRQLIDDSACDLIHIDVLMVGGLRNAKIAADLAGVSYMPAAVHNNWSMVGAVAASHVAAASPNFVAMELFQGYFGSELMTGLVQQGHEMIVDGTLALTDRPGLGISLDEEVCEHFLAPGQHIF